MHRHEKDSNVAELQRKMREAKLKALQKASGSSEGAPKPVDVEAGQV